MSKGFKLLNHFITFITGAILVNWLLYLSAGWELPNTEVIHFALVSIASPLAQMLIAVSAIGFLVGHGSIEVYKAKQLLKKECALHAYFGLSGQRFRHHSDKRSGVIRTS